MTSFPVNYPCYISTNMPGLSRYCSTTYTQACAQALIHIKLMFHCPDRLVSLVSCFSIVRLFEQRLSHVIFTLNSSFLSLALWFVLEVSRANWGIERADLSVHIYEAKGVGKIAENNFFYTYSFRHMRNHALNLYPELIKSPAIRSGVQKFMG